MSFYVPIECVRLARHCGNILARHIFPYAGLSLLVRNPSRDNGHKNIFCGLYSLQTTACGLNHVFKRIRYNSDGCLESN